MWIERRYLYVVCVVFDGIGSTIVSLIASAIIGGFTGYKIGIHKKIKLIQKAGNSSEQNQTIELNGESDDTNTSYNVNVNMEQKAKNNAKQTQIGGVRNGRS